MEEKNKQEKRNVNKVIIDLDESRYAHSFPKDQNVHQSAFDKLISLIKSLANKADGVKDKYDDDEFATIETHDAIAVFGQRGVGKTSFLKSVVKEIMQGEDRNDSIVVLPLIDPTLIEEKGHIFLLILSLINRKVESVLNKGELDPQSDAYSKRAEWKSKLEKLAKGLPSLDNVGAGFDNTKWQDATYIMNKGLINVESAHSLQRNFRLMVKCALRLLGDKKAFLLVFDDIDVNFQRGWSVLETIRKYLSIPEIITVISGNEKLYSKNVRKVQWKNFGKALLKNESDGVDEGKQRYVALVDELEEQYMQKLFKSDHRIQLYSLLVYVHNDSQSAEYFVKDLDGENGLRETYDSILDGYEIKMARVKQLCRDFLLSMPMRSQIQFLVDNYKGQGQLGINAFRSRMLDQGIDTDRLDKQTVISEILQVLLRKKLMKESYQLLPNMDDYEQNATFLGLNLSFSYFERHNPRLIFDYLLRIGYSRNMTEYLGYKGNIVGANVEDLCEYSDMLRERTYRDYIGNAIAYVWGMINNPRLIGQLRVKSKNTDGGTGAKIDEINKISEKQQRIIAWLPYCKIKYPYRNESRYYYSIYMLLASIGMIIECESEDEIARNLRESLKERDYIIANGQGKDRSQTSKEKDGRDSKEDEEEDYVDKTIEDADIKAFAKVLFEWTQKHKDVRSSTHTLGRISTRAYNAFESIQKRKYGANLGAEFQLFVAAFLNACLIEESQERLGNVAGVNLNNVRTEMKIFEDNKDVLKDKLGELPLSAMFLDCPILIPFLNGENELFKTLDKIVRFDIYGNKPIGKKEEKNAQAAGNEDAQDAGNENAKGAGDNIK